MCELTKIAVIYYQLYVVPNVDVSRNCRYMVNTHKTIYLDKITLFLFFITTKEKGGVSHGSIQRFKLEKSRRLGISLSGTGKELENDHMHQDNTVLTNVKIIRIWFTIT